MTEETECPGGVVDIPGLRDRIGVFADREEAGRRLAELMAQFEGTGALVLGIPAGGVPVAAALADELGLELDVAVVSKITLPWNTEAGYGAVAFDGTVRLNREMMGRLPLSEDDVEAGIEATREKVQQRVRELRGERPLPEVRGRSVILCDDGLASGFTMMTAINAVREAEPKEVLVAVPTAPQSAVRRIVDDVDCIYCCNVRGGMRFAVASAYEHWYDVPLDEVRQLLEKHQKREED